MKSLLLSLAGILLSAVPGTGFAWWVASLLQLDGLWMALTTLILAMVFSVALFALFVTVGRALRWIR